MRQLLSRVTAELDLMCAETDAAVVAELPELAERADAAVRRHVIEATFRWVLRRLGGHTGPDPEAEIHRDFGAAAAYAGMPLEHLAAGYHIGSRVGWAHIRRAVRELGLGGDLGLLLTDIQLAHVHEFTVASMIGYARAAQTARDQHTQRRHALIDVLLTGQATEEAAAAAGWTWPAHLAVAVIHGEPMPDADATSDVVLGTADGAVVAVGPAEALADLLDPQRLAVIGPTVPTDQARLSFDRARRLANLVATGALPRQGVLRWTDELPTIIVHSAPDAAAEHAARRLSPIRDRSPDREQMLRETLAAWLDHPHQPQAIAKALHLHPQTVRYRLARLRERLGADLDDPQARFEFALALRYQGTQLPNATAAGIIGG